MFGKEHGSVSSRYFRGTALDATTIDFLRQVNNDFYARCAPSFSASRNAPWVGWLSCLEAVQDCGAVRLCDGPDVHLYDRATAQPGAIRKGASVRVLDVACGNMRFAAFLREELRGRQINYFAVDPDCRTLGVYRVVDGYDYCVFLHGTRDGSALHPSDRQCPVAPPSFRRRQYRNI